MDTRLVSFRKALPGFLIICACLGLVAPAAGLDCVDYQDYVNVLSDERIDGQGTDVVLRDDIAYVCTDGTLKIIDVSDPASPDELSEVGPEGSRYVTIDGNLAYLTYHDIFIPAQNSGLQIVDISDPANPVALSTMTGGPARLEASFLVGDDLLVSSTYGLRVYDVTDPAAPIFTAQWPAFDTFVDARVLGDVAYLAGEDLQIVDISDPVAPVLITTLPYGYNSIGIEIAGDLLIVAGADNDSRDLLVYDLSAPTAPALLGSVIGAFSPLYYGKLGVRVKEDTVFQADYSSGLKLFDISDPAAPAELGRIRLGSMQWPTGVDIEGDNLCLSAYDDTVEYPVIRSWFTVVSVDEPGFVPVVGGDVACTAAAMEIDGDVAFLAAEADGVVSVDISDPEAPAVLDGLGAIGEARDIALDGHHAYVAAGADGLRIVDVADPADLTLTGSLAFTSEAWAVAVDYPVVYVGMDSGELVSVDVGDPAAPSVLDEIPLAFECNDVALYGDYLYFATNYYGVNVVDISDPAGLDWAGAFNVDDFLCLEKLIVVDDVLYAGTWWNFDDVFSSSIKAYDLSDPASPLWLDSHGLKGSHVRDLAADGSVLYVLEADIRIVDISNAADMQDGGMLGRSPRTIALADDRLMMMGYDGAAPEPLLTAPLHCTDVTAIDDPAAAAPVRGRLSAYPNPFNPKTFIRFEQAAAGPAHLAIYGLDGRLIRTLVSGRLAAGDHERQWDGLDDRGRPQSSGVYFAQFRGPATEAREKLVLLR